jgi:hypothetical protein
MKNKSKEACDEMIDIGVEYLDIVQQMIDSGHKYCLFCQFIEYDKKSMFPCNTCDSENKKFLNFKLHSRIKEKI